MHLCCWTEWDSQPVRVIVVFSLASTDPRLCVCLSALSMATTSRSCSRASSATWPPCLTCKRTDTHTCTYLLTALSATVSGVRPHWQRDVCVCLCVCEMYVHSPDCTAPVRQSPVLREWVVFKAAWWIELAGEIHRFPWLDWSEACVRLHVQYNHLQSSVVRLSRCKGPRWVWGEEVWGEKRGEGWWWRGRRWTGMRKGRRR